MPKAPDGASPRRNKKAASVSSSDPDEGYDDLSEDAPSTALSQVTNYSGRELEAFVKRLMRTSNPDVGFFYALPPKAKAYIAGTEVFQDFLLSMAFDAALGSSRLTRSQWKAMAWFKTKGPYPRAIKALPTDPSAAAGDVTVETTTPKPPRGVSPLDEELAHDEGGDED